MAPNKIGGLKQVPFYPHCIGCLSAASSLHSASGGRVYFRDANLRSGLRDRVALQLV